MTICVLKRAVVQQLLNDKECLHELNKTTSSAEYVEVLVKYARKRGFKVVLKAEK